LYFGEQGIVDLIPNTNADIVLNAIAGSSGLPATFAAIENHMDVALSNKESIVMAGNLLFDYADVHGVKIIPVDSEHSTLYALLEAFGTSAVHTLVLTASGGPFRNYPLDKMGEITVEMATAHPTWKMGTKISIDSATLANKGLEVIEASFLFGFSHDSIEVVIHPQSVVHSLVRMHNGALYAQLSPPDMSLPIVSALSDKQVELRDIVQPLDFTNLNLEFQKPDYGRFPLLPLAFDCAREQRGYPIAYNAANEIAVQAFVKGEIAFDKIVRVVDFTLAHDWQVDFSTLAGILQIDSQARSLAMQGVGNVR
jgi:1-deoxy-D-xylulose-5-phosphate reductoisomerase